MKEPLSPFPKQPSPSGIKPYGWAGIAVVGVAEYLLFFQEIPWIKTYFTPLVWSGYILFMDSLLKRRAGYSPLWDFPKEFLVLLPLSVGLWLIFEFYNLFFENWYYAGLPEEPLLRYLGYIWAFATIWPAILITAAVLGHTKWMAHRKMLPRTPRPRGLIILMILGLVCLILPFLLSKNLARYTAGPVWLGFIFLLDPLNYRFGRYSLLIDLEKGDPRKGIGLLLAGLICGFLWEFWNFWAGAKWHYTVPILEELKIFEMPVLGYLGFPAFALECYVMAGFLWNLAGIKKNAPWLRLTLDEN